MSDSEVLAFDVGVRRGNLAVWLVCLFAAIGIFAYLPQVIRGVRLWTWPTAPGQILARDVSSELLYVYVHRWGENSNVNESRLRVRYSYAVGGRSYVGSNIGYVRPYVRNSSSERSRLAVGHRVAVHYDPASPGDAVLDAAPPMDAVLWSTLSIAGLIWAGRRSLRRRRRDASSD